MRWLWLTLVTSCTVDLPDDDITGQCFEFMCARDEICVSNTWQPHCAAVCTEDSDCQTKCCGKTDDYFVCVRKEYCDAR